MGLRCFLKGHAPVVAWEVNTEHDAILPLTRCERCSYQKVDWERLGEYENADGVSDRLAEVIPNE